MLEKLTQKQKALLKISVWTTSIVWMIFFLAFSLLMANKARIVFNGTIYKNVLPIWIVFTSLLIIYFMARYIRRKLI